MDLILRRSFVLLKHGNSPAKHGNFPAPKWAQKVSFKILHFSQGRKKGCLTNFISRWSLTAYLWGTWNRIDLATSFSHLEMFKTKDVQHTNEGRSWRTSWSERNSVETLEYIDLLLKTHEVRMTFWRCCCFLSHLSCFLFMASENYIQQSLTKVN